MLNKTVSELIKNENPTLLEFAWELFIRFSFVLLSLVIIAGATIEFMRWIIG